MKDLAAMSNDVGIGGGDRVVEGELLLVEGEGQSILAGMREHRRAHPAVAVPVGLPFL